MSWWDDVYNAWEHAQPGMGLQDIFSVTGQDFNAMFTSPPPDTSKGQGGTAQQPSSTDFWNQLMSAYNAGATAGSGGGAAAPAGYYTPDGVWIDNNSSQDTYYRMIDAVWNKLYGMHPPWSSVQMMRDLGVENTSQLDTIMQEMPSHISNPDGSKIPLGVYDQMKGVGNTFSDKYFGRPIPDSLIQDWTNKGITDPESIELWFLNHPAKDIPKDVYGQLYDAAAGAIQKNWHDLPHPDTVHAAYKAAQQMANPAGTPGGP